MHIDDWWWQIQEQLNEKSIVMFICLWIDETTLTTICEKQKLWSIYINIDNLNEIIRKQRERLNVLFLSLISIFKEANNSKDFVRNEFYHESMKIMLKRKFFVIETFVIFSLIAFHSFEKICQKWTENIMCWRQIAMMLFDINWHFRRLFRANIDHWCEERTTLFYLLCFKIKIWESTRILRHSNSRRNQTTNQKTTHRTMK